MSRKGVIAQAIDELEAEKRGIDTAIQILKKNNGKSRGKSVGKSDTKGVV